MTKQQQHKQPSQRQHSHRVSLSGSWIEGVQHEHAIERKLVPLTANNEVRLRAVVFEFWRNRFALRQREGMLQANEQAPPTDLSGACYLMSQLSMAVFPVNGTLGLQERRRHAFVRFRDGSVYDINRGCADVMKMYATGIDPYRVTLTSLRSSKGQERYASWRGRVLRLAQGYFALPSLDRFGRDEMIDWQHTCPAWARPVHVNGTVAQSPAITIEGNAAFIG